MKGVPTAVVVLALLTGCVEAPTEQPQPPPAADVQPEPVVFDVPVPTPSTDAADASTFGREQARAASLRLRVT
jgi:uncharacterized lipoprotein YajG